MRRVAIGLVVVVVACARAITGEVPVPEDLRTCEDIATFVRQHADARLDRDPLPRAIQSPTRVPRNSSVEAVMWVDEEGRVEPGSIYVMGTMDFGARDALEQDIRMWSFQPAEVRGCPVRGRYRWRYRS